MNRGFSLQDIDHYLNTCDADILDPSLIKNIHDGVVLFISHVHLGNKIFLQIDSDCDGYTSAAAFLNYMNYLFPGYVQNNIVYRLHEGKQHGLIVETIPDDVKLVIALDSSSNDYAQHAQLKARGIDVLVIDHHETDYESPNACVINNQLCDYPTKSLSGVGMVYKFCSYIDQLMGYKYADKILDLVALGIIADVMQMKDFETKRIIEKGLNSVSNPYFRSMTIKNAFSLGEGDLTPFGVAFYIAPYINAVTRCGTQEEKRTLFDSMLDFKAYEMIPSTKRGFQGKFEQRVEQACRNCTNIKNRQNRSRDSSLDIIENIIQTQGLLNNQILIIKLPKENSIDSNLTGLVATKIANEYQKPTLILNETYDQNKELYWQGSGRIFSQSSFSTFKDFLEESGYFEYQAGHQGAFGAGIYDRNIAPFIEYSNAALANYDFSPKYYIDLIYDANFLSPIDIFNLASFDGIWGQGVEEPYVLVKNIKVTKENLSLLKGSTLKIILPADGQNISLIKFGSSQEEFDALTAEGYVSIDVIGHFQRNIYNGSVSPQISIEDYEIKNKMNYYF